MALLSALATEIAIPVCAVIGIAFSLVLWCLSSCNSDNSNDEDQETVVAREIVEARVDRIKKCVSEGVKSFLLKEYLYVGAFVVAFAILIFLCLGSVERFSTQSRPCKFDPSNTCKPALATAVFSTVSFLLGACTSAVSGFLGAKIAIYANARTALEERNFVGRTSIAAFRSGAVMGFLSAATGLLVLYLAIYLFKLYYGNDWEGLFEAITGYGLGASSMALFGRAGGGIYAKAADVCRHLVQKIEPNIYQDGRNPNVIPNFVGDIVGDIAGIGPDLFGYYAKSSCAALVVASISSFGIDHDFTAMCYPLLISSMDVLVCLITTLVGEIKPGLKTQLIISTILMTVGISIVGWIALPSSFTIYNFGSQKLVKNWQLSLCVGVGLWAGLIIGFVNKLYTSNAFRPYNRCLRHELIIGFVNKLCTSDAFSCLRLAAANGVSVSLASVTMPFFAAVSILVSSRLAATYGIAVAALGLLSTIATRVAINAYGPISDNAKRIAEIAGVQAPTAAGNTTAANGKFAIESAALVSIALFGAFVSRSAMSPVDILTPKVIIGLIMGAGLPYCFSAMTMKSVGRAGFKMAQEIRRELESGIDRLSANNEPDDYATIFKISNDASVTEMILPGAVVMLTPLIVGTIFGVEMLSGVLAGSLGSVVQIAILASNTGGAWNKAKEHIRAGALEYVTTHYPQELTLLRIAESGETIGDPLKDASGPPLNIFIQLMAIESLVFAPFFASHGGLLSNII